MDVKELLADLVKKNINDVFIIAGTQLSYKQGANIVQIGETILFPDDTRELVEQIYELASNRSMEKLLDKGDDDFSFAIKGLSRFRVNAYKQRNSLAAVIRVVAFDLPNPKDLGIPDAVIDLSKLRRGMVLITGPAGSGKTTTLACIIDQINQVRDAHIIMLENPIEYLHRHKRSLISQRELSIDTESYGKALRSALRQSPDVILIGELRDPETISIALTAAETGHLVLSTLHTIGAVNTIDRLVDSFSPGQQNQVRMQLSMVLQDVVSQQLLESTEGGVVPAFEIMHCNSAIRNLIREGRTHQMAQVINTSAAEGMVSMDNELLKLYKDGKVSENEMLIPAFSQESLSKLAGL